MMAPMTAAQSVGREVEWMDKLTAVKMATKWAGAWVAGKAVQMVAGLADWMVDCWGGC